MPALYPPVITVNAQGTVVLPLLGAGPSLYAPVISGPASYLPAVLADAPVFLLSMGEASGNLTDLIHSKTATAHGAPTYGETGPVVGVTAIAFPASTAYFDVADHADLDLGDGPFSIEAWIRRDADTGTLSGVLAKLTDGYMVGISDTDRWSLGKAAVTSTTYEQEVLADSPVLLYRMGEASGNLNDEIGSSDATPAGGPTYGVAGPTPEFNAIHFDDTDDSFDAGDVAAADFGTGAFTVEAWFKTTSADRGTIVSKKSSSGTDQGWALSLTDTNEIRWETCDGATLDVHTESSTGYRDGTWHHIAALRTGTTSRIYVDGVLLVGDHTVANLNVSNSTALRVGRVDEASYVFGGDLGYVALYASALSGARIAAHVSHQSVSALFTSSSSLAVGSSWRHCVVTRNGPGASNTKIYVDGTDVTTALDAATTLGDTSGVLEIGRNGSGYRSGAALAWLALYKSVLSPGRVTAHHDAALGGGSPPPPPPEGDYWATAFMARQATGELNLQSDAAVAAIATSGSGLISDPYVIYNRAFDALETGQGHACIYMRNLTVAVRVLACDFRNSNQAIDAEYCSGRLEVGWCRFKDIHGPNPAGYGGNYVQFYQCPNGGRIYNNKGREGTLEDNISLVTCSHFTVEDNALRGTNWVSPSGSGISLGDVNGGDNWAYRNRLWNPGQVGIFIAGGTNSGIIDNVIRGDQRAASNVGMYVWAQDAGPCYGHRVEGNRVWWVNAAGGDSPWWDAGNCGPVDMDPTNVMMDASVLAEDLEVVL